MLYSRKLWWGKFSKDRLIKTVILTSLNQCTCVYGTKHSDHQILPISLDSCFTVCQVTCSMVGDMHLTMWKYTSYMYMYFVMDTVISRQPVTCITAVRNVCAAFILKRTHYGIYTHIHVHVVICYHGNRLSQNTSLVLRHLYTCTCWLDSGSWRVAILANPDMEHCQG